MVFNLGVCRAIAQLIQKPEKAIYYNSELVLHLTDRLGLEAALPHLRGEFAFAVYERSADRLTLVRDRFGVKPLYWTLTPNGLVFGSEINFPRYLIVDIKSSICL